MSLISSARQGIRGKIKRQKTRRGNEMKSLPPLPSKIVTAYLLPNELSALSNLQKRMKLESLSDAARYCILKCKLPVYPLPQRSDIAFYYRKRMDIALHFDEYDVLQNIVSTMSKQSGKNISISTAIRSAIVYVSKQ